MCYCSMANVLTLGQQQFSVLHYQVQQRSVALSSNNFLVRVALSKEYDNPTLGSALKQAKKDVNTPELPQLIQYECLLLLSLLYQSNMSTPLPWLQPLK